MPSPVHVILAAKASGGNLSPQAPFAKCGKSAVPQQRSPLFATALAIVQRSVPGAETLLYHHSRRDP
jgi:hypothetical protein